jgi:tRNA threonylcarbamoyladenosine biosynthesis protein TsaB
MALILNIETASPVCSVSLSRNGITLGIRESDEDKSHATRLTIFIRELLEEQGIVADDLDALSLSMGPGSYTGLRIGASVAKGLAYGSGLPVIGIQTLKALAQGFTASHAAELSTPANTLPVLMCPMLDARRMEVYSALYDSDLNELSPVQALVLESHSFATLLHQHMICFFGTGSDKVPGVIDHPNARFFPGIRLSAAFQSVPAEAMFISGDFLDTAYFEPHYLKEFIASIPKNKVLGQSG